MSFEQKDKRDKILIFVFDFESINYALKHLYGGDLLFNYIYIKHWTRQALFTKRYNQSIV
jgi:hypothetical protein